jgi:hypothetical protein
VDCVRRLAVYRTTTMAKLGVLWTDEAIEITLTGLKCDDDMGNEGQLGKKRGRGIGKGGCRRSDARNGCFVRESGFVIKGEGPSFVANRDSIINKSLLS